MTLDLGRIAYDILEIKNFNRMKELSFEQMECINGGGWLADVWEWLTDTCQDAWEWLMYQIGNSVLTYSEEVVRGIGTIYQVGFIWKY
ncbi:MAG: hypothetical protein ACK5M7_18280 [Draconibacterium sp.]